MQRRVLLEEALGPLEAQEQEPPVVVLGRVDLADLVAVQVQLVEVEVVPGLLAVLQADRAEGKEDLVAEGQ
jgi:hypothetical protein